MKIHILIGVLFLVLAAVLTGCFDNNSNNNGDSRFFGGWEDPFGSTWYFYSNGTMYHQAPKASEEKVYAKWNVIDNELYLYIDNNETILEFEFSNNDETLKLYDPSGGPLVLNKKVD